MPTSDELHLGVALDGAGWHPAAWREPGARPAELFTPSYWVDLAQEAARGLLDFASFEDSLLIQSRRRGVPDDRTDEVRGRLDAVLVASRVAPATSGLGLVPVVTTTHTEPFHLSKAIATLDFVSGGRAGLQARVSSTAFEAAQFGRRTPPEPPGPGEPPTAGVSELMDEAADAVEVIRRLWDSWEDDAEIRDAASGRFIDRQKVHYIDFEGPHFSVRGPSITPRPPQGQPLVTVLAHAPVVYELAARSADVVFVTPADAADARRLVAEVRSAERAVGRQGPALRIVADLVVLLDPEAGQAEARRARLDARFGHPWRSDAAIVAGTPGELARVLESWRGAGVEGFRLRPAVLPHDLEAVTRHLVPLLQEQAGFRRRYEPESLRERLGLSRPPSRYAELAHATTPGGAW